MSNLDENKNIFNFIFSEAMKDATLMRAYEGEKTWLYECAETKWGINLKEFVKEVIKGEFKTQDKYDDKFMKLAKEICKGIEGEENFLKEPNFTFGNAQKLINMTMKYFYVMTYADGKKKDNFRFCHCPMDSVMLKSVWENYKEQFFIKSKDDDNYTKTKFCESWSKETFNKDLKSLPNRYKLFQELIRTYSGCENNLEYDYEKWGNKAGKTDE